MTLAGLAGLWVLLGGIHGSPTCCLQSSEQGSTGVSRHEKETIWLGLAKSSGTDESKEESLGCLRTCDEICPAGVSHLSGAEPSDSRERL